MFEHDDEDPTLRRLVTEERAVLDATELIAELLERDGASRSELARRLDVTPGEITHRLRGRNLTIKSLASTLDALDYDLVLGAKPRHPMHVGPVAWFHIAPQSVEARTDLTYDLPDLTAPGPLTIAV